ncbi:MAG TPA: c-type cytochrome domain-containing protein [Isosphaeraceae bacterium]|jgi:mono/diheme cytochrome c family protein|nr:c-type cytochrome domain-containing protein [Isosphaeraceae bacterium]
MRKRLRWIGLGLIGVVGAWVQTPASTDDSGTSPRRETVVQLAQAAKKKTKGKKSATAKDDAAAAKQDAAPAASEDGLKFSKDIAPILVGNCIDCHNPEKRRGKFDLTTFQKLMTGSDKGRVIVPGKPDDSHLVLHIKGEEDPKMPPGNRVLAAESISKIVAWVKAGARLDAGIEPTALLNKIAPSADDQRKTQLAKLSPEERDKRLKDAALERFKKAGAKTDIDMTSTTNFSLFGNLPKDRVAHTLKTLEAQYALLNKVLSRSPSKPALELPEKISVYVFNEAGNFVEFARSVENREVDATSQALANLGVEQPYLVAFDPLAGREDESLKKRSAARSKRSSDDPGGPERSLEGLLVEQLGTAGATKAGKAPRWLALGLGSYLGSQAEPRSPYYRHLRELTAEEYKLGWLTKAQEALGDATDADKVRAIGFSLMEWLASTERNRFPLFVRGMLEGQQKLDDVIQVLWGGASRQAFLTEWGTWVGARYGRGR